MRIPNSLYVRAHSLARARRTSVNALMRQLLEDLDRRECEAELAHAYELLGQETESDVEPFLAAQAEVARRG
jgi:hypothetical protein